MPVSHPEVPPSHPVLHAAALAALLATWLAAGCASSPLTPPPSAQVPATFRHAGPSGAADSASPPPVNQAPAPAPASTAAWWSVFGDPVLDDLQDRLAAGNEDLKAGVARIARARALLQVGEAARWPALDLGLTADRSREPGGTGGGHERRRSAALLAQARWEVDLWGRVARGVEAAQAGYRATLADEAALRLSLQAALTDTYLALRAAETRQALIGRTIVGLQRSQELTQARYDSGVAAQTDVLQAQTQLRLAQARQVDAQLDRDRLEHAIAALLGLPPGELAVPPSAALPPPPPVPALLPGAVLARRPDIAAERQRLLAAAADAGAAQADLLPSLTLSADAGWRSSRLGHLVQGPNLLWSLGASLVQPLIDGGRRRGLRDEALAAVDESAARYRRIVIDSLQEVEDNLVGATRLQAQAALQREALAFARRNLEITQEQYRVGTVSYLNVVTAQTSALDSEQRLVEIQAAHLSAINQLLKNVGGPWQAPEADGIRQDGTRQALDR